MRSPEATSQSRSRADTPHTVAAEMARESYGPEAEERLHGFVELLIKWSRVYNLTSIDDPERIWTHHIFDSLAVAPPLDRILADNASPELLDVGSGAGLPGIPLAIIRPQWRWTLIDSNSKKTSFIQQAVVELACLNVSVHTRRIEQLASLDHRSAALRGLSNPASHVFDAIVARAFSSLPDLVRKSESLLAPGGVWAAMKGTVPHDEIRQLPAHIRCREIIPLEVPGLEAQRHLIVLDERQ